MIAWAERQNSLYINSSSGASGAFSRMQRLTFNRFILLPRKNLTGKRPSYKTEFPACFFAAGFHGTGVERDSNRNRGGNQGRFEFFQFGLRIAPAPDFTLSLKRRTKPPVI